MLATRSAVPSGGRGRFRRGGFGIEVVEHGAGYHVPRLAAVGRVEGDVEPESAVRVDRQIGMKSDRVAAVPHEAMAVVPELHEAVRHAGQALDRAEQPRVHQSRGLGLKDAGAVQFPAVHVGHDEARHVVGGGCQGAGGPEVPDVLVAEQLETLADVGIAGGHVGIEGRGQRLVETRVVHAERFKDVARHVLLEGHARDVGHHQARQRRRPVRVGRGRAGGPLLRRRMGCQRFGQGHEVVRRLGEEVADAPVLEPRRMGERVLQGDGAVAAGNGELIDVLADRRIESHLALFEELHHGRPGDEFRDGTGSEQVYGRVRRCARFQVRVAVALGKCGLPIVNEREHRPHQVVILEQGVHHPVQVGLERRRRRLWFGLGFDVGRPSRVGAFPGCRKLCDRMSGHAIANGECQERSGEVADRMPGFHLVSLR